jgi:hypothetical protein
MINTDLVDFYSGATFHIEVNGYVKKSTPGIFTNARIQYKTAGKSVVSFIDGEIIDQAELIGMLNSLYNMRFPIIKVALTKS